MENGFADERAPARGVSVTTLIWVCIAAFVAGLAAMAIGFTTFGQSLNLPWAARPAATQQPAAAVITPDPAALNALAHREVALNARIGELEERLSGIDSDSRTASGFATRAEGLMVAFAARRALDRGLPLGYMEAQLRERFGAARPQAVATVVRAARDPVTLEDLRLGLDTASAELLNGDTDIGWLASARRELSNLIVLRHEGAPSPRPTERLQRARRMLDAGQVESALAEVQRMPGVGDAQGWVDAAKRYVAARRALDAIETTALEGGGQPVAQPRPAESSEPSGTEAKPQPIEPDTAPQADNSNDN